MAGHRRERIDRERPSFHLAPCNREWFQFDPEVIDFFDVIAAKSGEIGAFCKEISALQVITHHGSGLHGWGDVAKAGCAKSRW